MSLLTKEIINPSVVAELMLTYSPKKHYATVLVYFAATFLKHDGFELNVFNVRKMVQPCQIAAVSPTVQSRSTPFTSTA
eukprot:3762651-Amphidinium_carterae.1